MGCDIHAYIDFDEFLGQDEKWHVDCFADSLSFGRNYTLFTLMAGVRYDPRIDRGYEPLFQPPRGLFERLSWTVSRAYTLRIDDDHPDWDNCCSRQDAMSWLKSGSSHWVDESQSLISGPDWHSTSWLSAGELKRVKDTYEKIEFYDRSWFQSSPPTKQSIPDNATATRMISKFFGTPEWYVTVGERKTYPAPPYLAAIIAAMEALNKDKPDRSRLIFWFDN